MPRYKWRGIHNRDWMKGCPKCLMVRLQDFYVIIHYLNYKREGTTNRYFS